MREQLGCVRHDPAVSFIDMAGGAGNGNIQVGWADIRPFAGKPVITEDMTCLTLLIPCGYRHMDIVLNTVSIGACHSHIPAFCCITSTGLGVALQTVNFLRNMNRSDCFL